MRKIPTLFRRDFAGDPSRVLPEYHDECLWVRDGEGRPTRKLDGMCCAVIGGVFVKRREVRKGQQAPDNFRPIEHYAGTGKTVGWVPVGDGPEDRYFREALAGTYYLPGPDCTFELVGPKSRGNAEGYSAHWLIPHDNVCLDLTHQGVPRDFEGLREWLAERDMEGLVWHHPDGRMAKIKGRDFGFKRPPSHARKIAQEFRPEGTGS